jgi:phosphoglycolate phosphatase
VSPIDRARVRGVCLDLDGTLVETDDAIVATLARWLWPVRRLLPVADPAGAARRLVMAAETPANSFLAIIDRLSLDDALAPLLDRLHRARGLEPAYAFEPVAGALDAVRRLSARLPLALITSREARSALAFLDAFQLQGDFACVVTARTTRRGKPHPEPAYWAAARLGLAPQACLMVGDTTVDIRAGRAAGMQTAGVLGGFGERDELERAGADVILGSVRELPEVLSVIPDR